MSSLEAKIVVLGAQGVGKTSLVMRYCKGAWEPSQITPTVGASFLTKRVVDADTDTTVRLQIWDTAGQERFRSISRLYYRGANACILCYSITDAQSFAEMGVWLTELRRNLPGDVVLHVVGTKADIVARDPSARQVPFERCIAYVAENLAPGQGGTPPPTASGASLLSLNGLAAASSSAGGAATNSSLPSTSPGAASNTIGYYQAPTSAADHPQSPSSKRSSGFWGQEVGWDACHEISAESGEGVEEVFRVVTRKLVEQNRKMQQALLLATSSLNSAHAGITPGFPSAGPGGPSGYDSAGFDGDYFGSSSNPSRGSFRVGRDRRSWLFPPSFSPAVTIDRTGGSADGQAREQLDGQPKKRCC